MLSSFLETLHTYYVARYAELIIWAEMQLGDAALNRQIEPFAFHVPNEYLAGNEPEVMTENLEKSHEVTESRWDAQFWDIEDSQVVQRSERVRESGGRAVKDTM